MLASDIFGVENRAQCIKRLSQLSGCKILRKPVSVSAVLIPLCVVRGIPCILFVQREMRLRAHPGEIGFPGGKCDPSDDGNLVRTALRETHEEIGLYPSSIDVWCTMSRIDARSTIYPVVGYCGDLNLPEPPCTISTDRWPSGSTIQPNVDEVARIVVRPIAWLVDQANLSYTHFRLHSTFFSLPEDRGKTDSVPDTHKYRPHSIRYTLPAFGAHPHTQSIGPRIWGLSAIMTYHVLYGLLSAQHKTVAMNHVHSRLTPIMGLPRHIQIDSDQNISS